MMKKLPVHLSPLTAEFCLVELQGKVIGAVSSGELDEDSNGELRYKKDRSWVIVGREYQKFLTRLKAIQALVCYVSDLCDAKKELSELRFGESFLPIYRRVARWQKSMEAGETAKTVKRNMKKSRKNYCEAMDHAGYSKLVY